MKRKVRKYVEGGYGDVSSEDYGMGSREEMIERNIEENERRRQAEALKPSTSIAEFEEPETAGFSRTAIKTAPKPAARPATKPASRPAPKPTAQPSQQAAKPMGRTAMGKTVEQEMAAIEAGRKAAGKADLERRMAYDKPLERVNPESNLIGGAPLRGAKAMATGAKEFAGYLKQKFAKDASSAPAKPFPERNKRRLLARDSRGEDVIESRKSGGKVGSASRRGDGIASRGKTRGKYI
jgi:hypothetical protein